MKDVSLQYRPKNWKTLSFSESDASQENYKEYLGGGEELWKLRGTFQLHLLQCLGIKDNDSVLDIGCGPLRAGVHIISFLNTNKYTGIDCNADFIEICQKIINKETSLCNKHPQFMKVDSFDFSQIKRSFDIVLVFSVLNHCKDDMVLKFLENAPKLLKPKGKIIVTHTHNINKFLIKNTKLKVCNIYTNTFSFGSQVNISNMGWPDGCAVFPIWELSHV